ncbi:MAG: hypothetical protein CMK36_08890 [Porticoccaceae bacterium]|nr:hypothetical protein [Porticoccaceae bacterium]
MSKKVNFFLIYLMLNSFLTISSCGWQVRGSETFSGDIVKIWLGSENIQQPLLQDLTQALNKSGLLITKRKQDADYLVVITKHRNSRKTGTYNTSLRTAEYRLLEEVDFTISNSDAVLVVAQSTASVERVFNFIEQDVMASSFEERSLKSRMKLEIARQIISHLRTAQEKDG